jgi:hypothetical protein
LGTQSGHCCTAGRGSEKTYGNSEENVSPRIWTPKTSTKPPALLKTAERGTLPVILTEPGK